MTARQLLALGLTRSGIERRRAAGRLTSVHQGVYAVGHAPARWTRQMAAVLACGAGARVARRSAAVWHMLDEAPGRAVDIVVPGARRASRAGISVHGTRELHARDARRIGPVPVVGAARVLLELAASADGWNSSRRCIEG